MGMLRWFIVSVMFMITWGNVSDYMGYSFCDISENVMVQMWMSVWVIVSLIGTNCDCLCCIYFLSYLAKALVEIAFCWMICSTFLDDVFHFSGWHSPLQWVTPSTLVDDTFHFTAVLCCTCRTGDSVWGWGWVKSFGLVALQAKHVGGLSRNCI